MVNAEVDIPEPQCSSEEITALDLEKGMPVLPLDRMRIMDNDTWEDFTLELVYQWKKEYKKVTRCGGGGDMGRDVIAYNDDGWENFQCKHYGRKLNVADAVLEIGKVIYYSYKNEYTLPNKYYFVSPEGNSTDLIKTLNSVELVKKELISRWDKICREKITKKNKIELDGDFLDYVENKVNFSIFDDIPPMRLIELHHETRYYLLRFGLINKKRPKLVKAPEKIAERESTYIEELLNVLSQKSVEVFDLDNIKLNVSMNKELKSARNNFFAADSLDKFSRDWLPDGFIDLKDECYEAISATVNQSHKDNYERYLKTSEQSVNVDYNSHPLTHYIKTQDKKGLCHHLVNDGEISWFGSEK